MKCSKKWCSPFEYPQYRLSITHSTYRVSKKTGISVSDIFWRVKKLQMSETRPSQQVEVYFILHTPSDLHEMLIPFWRQSVCIEDVLHSLTSAISVECCKDPIKFIFWWVQLCHRVRLDMTSQHSAHCLELTNSPAGTHRNSVLRFCLHQKLWMSFQKLVNYPLKRTLCPALHS